MKVYLFFKIKINCLFKENKEKINLCQAINQALNIALEEDPNSVCFGWYFN